MIYFYARKRKSGDSGESMNPPKISNKVRREGKLRHKDVTIPLMSLKLYPLSKGQRTISVSQTGDKSFLNRESVF